MSNKNLSLAVWLHENKNLSPQQIIKLCPSLHLLQAIMICSDTCTFEELSVEDPIKAGIITQEQIDRTASTEKNVELIQSNTNKRYIPKMLRKYIPGIVIWFKNTYQGISNKRIAGILGITEKRINDINKQHLVDPISAVDPVSVRVIKKDSLDQLINEI